ncbi:MAG: acetyl-CoA carboxylase biotin carboxyl carrier protein subunit [Chitinophagales bacterium]|nr:acetyl-CoA carboxylase biotin carboxyl carrier protein subunit [Chitinophagales bacterium]
MQAIVNNQLTLTLDPQRDLEGLDLVSIAENRFHLLQNDQSHNIEVVSLDTDTKTVKININGTNYTVSLKDKLDLLLEQMGIGNAAAQKINDLKAPMPGLVLEIKVIPGDMVEKGDALIVLEAMKMENVLKAAAPARIKSIEVKQGIAVEKGQILIKFD